MRWVIRVLALIAVAVNLSEISVMASQQAERGRSADRAVFRQNTQPTPPYHKSAKEAKPLPRLVPASNFSDRPVVARAYQIASEIPFVLAQQPCYCACDKALGHSSLLDCYASSHTAGCGICIKETFFAFQMTKQGKRPAKIREAIISGDWKKVDINQGR